MFARDPLAGLGEEHQRQRLQQARIPRARDPVGLVVVRAGRHHHRSLDPGNLLQRELPAALDHVHQHVRVGHLGDQRGALRRYPVIEPSRRDRGAVEAAEDGVGRRRLGHGPMIGPMPRCVLVGVANHARGRGHVAGFGPRLRKLLREPI